jgi:hypothetical protein
VLLQTQISQKLNIEEAVQFHTAFKGAQDLSHLGPAVPPVGHHMCLAGEREAVNVYLTDVERLLLFSLLARIQ